MTKEGDFNARLRDELLKGKYWLKETQIVIELPESVAGGEPSQVHGLRQARAREGGAQRVAERAPRLWVGF